LIFSGNLGYQGGSVADMQLLEKVDLLKKHKPNLEIGWDGGVNDQNVAELVLADVDVLNVGGFLQTSANPVATYHALSRIADETGTT
jgi:pentose-5-phosphate-3-epimerase